MGTLIDIGNNNRDPVIINNLERECASEVDLTSEYLKTKNKLAEFVTKQDKKEARDNLDINAGTISYTISDYSDITNVKQALDKILRKPLTINKFSVTPNIYDIGEYLTNFTITWEFSKTPDTVQLFINNQKVDISVNRKVVNGQYQGDVNITLKGTQDDEQIEQTINILAVKPLYFGTNVNYKLNQKILTSSNTGTVTIDAGNTKYIYMITPYEIIPSVNGFEGGFEQLPSINILTQIGTTFKYNVYRSDFAGLGKTTILWRQK